MRKKSFFSGVAVLLILSPVVVSAQVLREGARAPSMRVHDCATVEDLSLSATQREAKEKIDGMYSEEMNLLRGELMRTRLELQAVFANPNADEERIRAVAKEVSELQSRCLATMVERQIKIRSILKPEQLRKWCNPVEPYLKGWCSKEP
jgi:Spy/CpxP family protein refolding chaperone